MSDEPKYRDEDWLREQYAVHELIAAEIANKCDCSERTVQRWLDRFDIETRPGGTLAERKAADERLTDPEWVRKQYISDKKSTREIAKKIDCSRSAVQNWINKHGIDTSDRRNEPILRLKDRQWLREQYVKKGKSGYEIADETGVCTTTVYKWIRVHGITIQYNGRVSGEEHWWYSGGSKPYGPGWNEAKKRSVRERDDYSCQDPRCSVTQADHLDEYGEKLHVHHLRKARDVDDPEKRNAKENLITLCRDCHRRWEKIADAGLVPEVSRA